MDKMDEEIIDMCAPMYIPVEIIRIIVQMTFSEFPEPQPTKDDWYSIGRNSYDHQVTVLCSNAELLINTKSSEAIPFVSFPHVPIIKWIFEHTFRSDDRYSDDPVYFSNYLEHWREYSNPIMYRTFLRAVSCGHLHVVQWMCHMMARHDLNLALKCAATHGHLYIVRLLLTEGADDLDMALLFAASNDHLCLVHWLVVQGATKLNRALPRAASRGHLRVVKWLVHEGATNMDRTIRYATRNNQTDVLQWLNDYLQ